MNEIVNGYIQNIMRGTFGILRYVYSRFFDKNWLKLAVCDKPAGQNETNRSVSIYKIQDFPKKVTKKVEKVEKRKKPPLTHFLSIPLNRDSIINKVREFKIDVLENIAKSTDITEKLFQKPERLHITIGMLSLQNKEQLEEAENTLKQCLTDVVRPFVETHGLTKIELKGVAAMGNNPAKTRVVYAKITDEFGRLQELCDKVMVYFIQKGVMEEQYDSVNLHITLMNTTFRSRQKNEDGKKFPLRFDATKIIEAHRDTLFGEITLNTIHLSQRYKYTEDGYYFPAAKIDFDNIKPKVEKTKKEKTKD